MFAGVVHIPVPYMSRCRIHVLTQDLRTRIMLQFLFFKQMDDVGNEASRATIPGGVNAESTVPSKDLVCLLFLLSKLLLFPF